MSVYSGFVPQDQVVLFTSNLSGFNKYGLLTKCEVKMAGYRPSSFFCVFMNRDGVEVHKRAKKERGQYPTILTEQAWSIKDLLYHFHRNFSCGTQRVVPSGQDSSILPARVANHSVGFDSAHIFTIKVASLSILFIQLHVM